MKNLINYYKWSHIFRFAIEIMRLVVYVIIVKFLPPWLVAIFVLTIFVMITFWQVTK